MNWLRRVLDTLRVGRLDRELDEEMRFHIDMRSEAYERDGLSPAEARRAAIRRFGSPLLARERTRDVRLLTWLDSVRQDAWLGIRLLRRSPALAAAALLSLGLAISATSGVFAVGDSLLLRTLPVARPQELLVTQWQSTEWPKIGIWGSNDSENNNWSFAYAMYQRFAQTPGLDVAGFQDMHTAVTFVNGAAGTADGSLVTGEFFGTLGLVPAAGRLLDRADNTPSAAPVVVISHRYWLRTFGGDPAAIGRSMRINGVTFTVVGVAPAPFFGMVPGHWADFYVPACLLGRLMTDFAREDPLTNDRFWWLQLVVRPKPGVTPAAVQASLGTQFAAFVKPHITDPKQHARFGLRSGAKGFGFEDEDEARPVLVLAVLVTLVLLIACANVANLLLARAASRRREAAMRLALGAGRLRVIRQHVTEGLVLSLASGAVGLLVGRWFGAALLRLAPERSALVLDLSLTWRDIAFTGALSVAAGLLVGLAPALSLARTAVSSSLRAGTTVRTGWRQRFGLGRSLVAVQIALSLLLLVVAGLLVRSLANLNAVPLGFSPSGLVLFNVDPTAAGLSGAQREAMVARLDERLGRLPGVRSVAWSTFPLLDGINWMNGVAVEGEPASKDRKSPSCFMLGTSPRYHQALGIPLVAGRFFDERDGPGAPKVAIANQAFVRQYLHGGPALGRAVRVEVTDKPERFEIVGVVRDTKYSRIRQEVRPILFFADAQSTLPLGPTFVLKMTGGQDARLAESIAAIVHEEEPTLPVTRIRTYRDQIDQQLSVERSLSLLSVAFGVVALLLAAVGLYGVIAFAVARRTAEMGVRLALGASRTEVLRLVMTDSARVIAPGAVAGIAAAAASTRMLRTMLFGLEPNDPVTLGLALAVLLGVVVLAAFVPARRAASIDPVEALRCE